MSVKNIVFLFFLSSILFITLVVVNYADVLHSKRIELERLSKIQHICMKSYLRKRKIYTPQRSLELAQKEIDIILKKSPLTFQSNSILLNENNTSSISMKKVLREIVSVVNHVDADVILTIETHTDNEGSSQHNLKLSQERADVLKDYFFKRTKLPLIVAIGYGEELPLTEVNSSQIENRRVEINLKRIQ